MYRAAIAGILLMCTLVLAGSHSASAQAGSNSLVTLVDTPDGGIQPQAAVDMQGRLHLVYFKGDPAHGDLFYVHRGANESAWSAPIRVNSLPGTAIAIGGIRGAQVAFGKDDRLHVVWNGSSQAPTGPGGAPMLYTRLNDAGTAFEPERNLITWAGNIDGGGAVAADKQGNVYVLWHATPQGKQEKEGGVYLARSTDNGKTFAREKNILTSALGACACCGMKALAQDDGRLLVLYRAATNNTARGTYLIASADRGKTFNSRLIEPWPVNACPMSAFDLARAGNTVLGAWETQGQVSFARFDGQKSATVAAPGASRVRKYPVVARDGKVNVLFAWSEGSGWQRGGALAYQVYGKDGKPLADPTVLPNAVPVWGVISAVARPTGGFFLFH